MCRGSVWGDRSGEEGLSGDVGSYRCGICWGCAHLRGVSALFANVYDGGQLQHEHAQVVAGQFRCQLSVCAESESSYKSAEHYAKLFAKQLHGFGARHRLSRLADSAWKEISGTQDLVCDEELWI